MIPPVVARAALWTGRGATAALGLVVLLLALLSLQTADRIHPTLQLPAALLFPVGWILVPLVVIHHRRLGDRIWVWVVLLGLLAVANDAMLGTLSRWLGIRALVAFAAPGLVLAVLVGLVCTLVRRDVGIGVVAAVTLLGPATAAVVVWLAGGRGAMVESLVGQQTPSWLAAAGAAATVGGMALALGLASAAGHTVVIAYREVFGLPPRWRDARAGSDE